MGSSSEKVGGRRSRQRLVSQRRHIDRPEPLPDRLRRTQMARRVVARSLVVFVSSGVGLLGVAALPASAAKLSVPASLDGESFSGTPTFSNEACNPNEASSFDYSVNGVARGPYAGTFSETGSVTVGPQRSPENSDVGTGTLTVYTGTVQTLQATFTIQTSQGVVTGTKTVVAPIQGACENSGEFQFGPFNQTVPVILRRAYSMLSYTATIPTSKKTYCDSGSSALFVGEFITPDFGTMQSPTFTESFSSAGSVNAEHGHKTC